MRDAAGRSVLCVDIGGTSTKSGVLGPTGHLLFVDSIPTEPDVDDYFRRLAALIERTAGEAAHNELHLRGLGVAVAGFLSPERDRLFYNSNLSWLEGFPLRRRLAELVSLPIEMEVDSNAACMAEYHFGSGTGSKRFLCLAAGTGLGGGMCVDGSPLRFAHGCLGDIGHIIVKRDGPLCTCGGRGCAEIMVSAPALARQFAEQSGSSVEMSLRNVIEEAQAGDQTARNVLNQAGEWLGLAIASMANVLFPDHIAIAGGLSAAGDLVLTPAERVFRESAAIFARENVTFSKAILGSSATLIGASWPFWMNRDEVE